MSAATVDRCCSRASVLRRAGALGLVLLGSASSRPALAEWRVPCGRDFVLHVDADGDACLLARDGRPVLDLHGWLLETSAGATRLRDCDARVDLDAAGDSTVVAIATITPRLVTELRYVCLPRQPALRIDLSVTYGEDLWLAAGGLEVGFDPSLRILSGPWAIAAGEEACNQQQACFTQRVLSVRDMEGGGEFRVHGRHHGARGVELLSPEVWLFYDGEAHCTVLTRPTFEEPREFCDARRVAGQRDRMTVVLDFAAGRSGVGINTFPGTRPAALTIVDDADGECRDLLLAAYFGTSDTTDAGFGRGGLLGNGLRTTRTVFASSRLYDVWDRLYRAGAEIALHTPSGSADSASATRGALADLVPRYGLRQWVDHAAAGNPEDLIYRGSYPRDGNPFYVLDQLEAAGCEYAWVEYNMFRGFDAFADRRELPHLQDALDDPGVPGRLWIYGRGGGVFFENYSACMREVVTPAALDELARRAGLAILYTHTCVVDYQGQDVGYLKQEGGTWVVKPEAQELFALIAARVAAGELWVAPAVEVFDRMRAMEALVLSPAEDLAGGWRRWGLRNAGERELDEVGLCFQGCSAVSIDGEATDLTADGWLVVPRIAAGTELALEARAAESPAGSAPHILARPNPCRGSTQLACFSQPAQLPELEIHDCGGRLIWQGRLAQSSPTQWAVVWDGIDRGGRPVESGRYWVTWRRLTNSGATPIVLVR
jgi:hypothetical protein